ncbi:MAG: sigma-70 family RNA polymerase sigma factor [Clostridia bacterium]|nr:sigma-70 family RNA polymerase sigma factor [Clostridia bacterium]
MQSKTDKLVTDNLGLVHSCCHKFTGRAIEYDDLFQIGCVGLIKAAERFDETKGFCFSTYAVPVILGEIKRVFRDTGPVKVSRSLKELGIKVVNVRTKLENQLGREPTVSEIANILNVDATDVSEAVCAMSPTVSLTFEDDDGTKETELTVGDITDTLTNKISVQEAINSLDEEERIIITERYFNEKTQNSLAQMLNMTQVQVSRKEKKTLLKLKSMLK